MNSEPYDPYATHQPIPASEWRPIWAIAERMRQRKRNERRAKIFCAVAITLELAAVVAILWQAVRG